MYEVIKLYDDNNIIILYTAKHSRGKAFVVGIERLFTVKMFAVAASFNNECLWVVNYLS